jgi:hypothetical protein
MQIMDSLLHKAMGKIAGKIYPDQEITGMKPQSKLWKQIRKLAAGHYTLRFAGLFDLQISIHFVFEI